MRNTVLISLFCAITAILGFFPSFYIPGLPVPIVLQNMGFMLAGSILGYKRGFLSSLLFVFLVFLGLPLLTGGKGGLSVFLGPSAGFVIGFPVVAFLVGFLNEKMKIQNHFFRLFLANFLAGIVFSYFFGVIVMAFVTKMKIGSAFFLSLSWLAGDILKCIFATWISLRTKKYIKQTLD